ncbi:MAG: sodium:solute symporter family protein [Thermoanaerobaculia bacterium]
MTLTLVLLALYLVTVFLVGAAQRRRAGAGDDAYYVANRSLNTFWGTIGLASLTTGGSTTIVLASLVYTHGVSGLWFDLAGAIGLAALGLALARRVRREAAVTLPEIVGRAYGPRARWTAALLVLVSEIVWFALLTEATQVVLTAALGLAPTSALVISTAVFVLYTSLGGQFAVVRTDLVQYGLMVLCIPGIACFWSVRAAAGLSGLPADAWSFPVSATLGWGDIAGWLILVGLPHLVGSDVYAKLLSCKDEATARRSALLAAASKLAFGLAVASIALAARKALPPMPVSAVLPGAVLGFLPPALAALVLVALVATMQSSADAVLLSATAVTARDLAPASLGRALPISAGRWLTPLYGALGLGVAIGMNRNVLETLKLGYSIFAAGLILPVLAALLPRRPLVPTAGAVAAMIAGGAVAAAARFAPALALGYDPVLAGTAVNLAILCVAALGKAGSKVR